MKIKQPLVSIIMSTYNGSKYISESIESVLGQTYTNFEFIIINDCSTDNVENIILKYKEKEDRIIYIKNDKNLKLTKSLNKGLEISKGDYIARIDDDDIWCDENKLKKQVEFMEQNKDYGLCGTNVIVIDKDGNESEKTKMREKNDDIQNHLLQSNQFVHSSIIMRKIILNKIGMFYDENFNGAEDYELWLRIGEISQLYNLQSYCIKYRYLHTSISRKKRFNQEILTLKAMRKHKKYYKNKCKSFILRLGYFVFRFIKSVLGK